MIKIQRKIEAFPSNAKLWFYWIPRDVTVEEMNHFQNAQIAFLSEWKTHGKANVADVWLIENRCILIIAGNNHEGVSGCSIDKSVAWIKSIASVWQVDLLDRNWVMYKNPSESWEMVKLNQFWAMRKANIVSDETLLLDPTITDFSQIEKMIKPFAESWHAQMWH